ncbi:Uncharacterised protein [Edwardsiella ictaluri]|nr:Uncharacterised protein [Edwardsiella ictaluri]
MLFTLALPCRRDSGGKACYGDSLIISGKSICMIITGGMTYHHAVFMLNCAVFSSVVGDEGRTGVSMNIYL